MATTIEELTRVKYAGRDFWTFYDDLKTRIRAEYGSDYDDWMESALGVMLVDIISWVADNLSFYLDRQATDSYLTTAQTRTAVDRLARQIGYKMYGSVSGSVDLTVSLDDDWGFLVTLPEGFKFKGPNDLIFEATQDVVFPAHDQGPYTVAAREGETKNQLFVSNGSKNQVFRISGVPEGQFLVADQVQVHVDGDEWIEKEFLEFEQTNQYEIAYGSAPPEIRFGNGVAGNIPISGSEILVQFVANNGKDGFASSGSIEDVVTPLIVSGNQIPMTITNASAVSGASDGESIAHTKAVAPKYFKTRRVAITREDIESLARAFVDVQFGTVEVAQAFSTRSASSDGYLSGRLGLIRNTAANPVPEVQTETDGITTDLSEIDVAAEDAKTQADTTNSLIGQASDGVNPATGLYLDAANAISDVNDARNIQDAIKVDAGDIRSHKSDIDLGVTDSDTAADAAIAAVNAYPAGSTRIQDPEKSALLAYLDTIKGENADISNSAGLVDTEASNIESNATASKGKVEDSVVDIQTLTGKLPTITDAMSEVVTDRDTIISGTSNIAVHVTAIVNVVVDSSSTIDDACDDVYDHVDSLLSADCKANLIEVPILTRDSGGFYVAPSIALVQALQNHLDAIKEPTVTIKVMSGGSELVAAGIEIDLGVSAGVVKAKAKSTAETIVDGILKDRKFGISLYRSQLDDPLSAMDGVQWVNVRITAPAIKLDADGNLIITKLEMITKGTVVVTLIDAE